MNDNSKIFSNLFTLQFKSSTEMNILYKLSNLPQLIISNRIFTFLLFTITIITAYPFYTNIISLYCINYSLCYATLVLKSLFTLITTILMILTFIEIKNIHIKRHLHKVIIITLYVLYFLISFEINIIINQITKIKLSYFHFIFFIVFLIICIWHFLQCIEFIESLPLNLIMMIISFIFTFIIGSYSGFERIYITITLLFMFIGIIAVSYVMTFQLKKSFYYYKELQSKNIWYSEILNNLNCGFINVDDSKVCFVNSTLRKKIGDKINENDILYEIIKHLDKDNKVKLKHSSDKTLQKTLQLKEEIQNINNIIPKTEILFIKEKESNLKEIELNNFIHLLYQLHLNNINKSNERFQYIGRGEIITNKNKNKFIYETLIRFETINKYQIIVNDITRARLYEQNKAEFHYKNLLLSKIAHEFKNPLICITELSSQLKQLICNTNKPNDIIKITELISSFSEYLLILIKGLDYFSLSQLNKKCPLSKNEVSLLKLSEFCRSIANALLQRSNKYLIIFQVIMNTNSTYIITDEIKLKQILVNLISNAIKFTIKGKVVLEIKDINHNNQNYLRFIVKDSGRGINKNNIKKLFQPYSKFNYSKDNSLGIGLGLTISNEIASRIASGLNIESIINEGTTFWFDITNQVSLPLQKQSSESINTIKNDNIILYHNELSFPDNNNTNNIINIILADDEELPRKATARILNTFAYENKIHINIIEVEDGVDILKYFYSYELLGIPPNINVIISDETMKFISGSKSAELIYNYTTSNLYSNNMKCPLFFLVTAYGTKTIHIQKGIDGIFSKPLTKENIRLILFK